MRRMTLAAVAICVIGLALGYRTGFGQKGETNDVDAFMRAKLEHCQKVLEGLTKEKYDTIAYHAQELSLLSQAAQWQVLQTPEYLQRSVEFRRASDALTESGRNRNLDGAALNYVNVTMKCVECHKFVRRVRMAQLDLPKSSRPVKS